MNQESNNKYIYPAILKYDVDGISVEFPDFKGCYTCGNTEEEALENAREALGLHIYGMKEDNDQIPTPTDGKNIKNEPNQQIRFIEVCIDSIRNMIRTK